MMAFLVFMNIRLVKQILIGLNLPNLMSILLSETMAEGV
jgi:hypothetical protein